MMLGERKWPDVNLEAQKCAVFYQKHFEYLMNCYTDFHMEWQDRFLDNGISLVYNFME
jgi:hypothetical protein